MTCSEVCMQKIEAAIRVYMKAKTTPVEEPSFFHHVCRTIQMFPVLIVILVAIFVTTIVIDLKEERVERRAVQVAAPVLVPHVVKEVFDTEVASFSSDSETVVESDSAEEVTDVKVRRVSLPRAVKGVTTARRKMKPTKGTKVNPTADATPVKRNFTSIKEKARSLRRWSV
ncbi:hypothetical protein BDV98DRAFT_605308 [Pterulicium gracile]|uniref:Uncharacterized protein n=1 Tax=Pterulicium gracile TaxID=1884261 RepID=A0A5C3QF42_9AGAR|nr:hypothetical protein BDV98DRAFT_605308 [Pterula gracilis]